jgi:methylamine---corrinoid protein Co-methyltransferase
VAHAGLGLTRQEANELVLACLPRYERTLATPNPGKPFPELYNTDTLEPGQEWADLYADACFELSRLGLDVNGGWRKPNNDRYTD